MTNRLLIGAALLAFAQSTAAQDHAAHHHPPAGSESGPKEGEYCVLTIEGAGSMACTAKPTARVPAAHPPTSGIVAHGQVDHSAMDHSTMDHSQMSHGPMEADMTGAGSGTARLPKNEAMNHGAMIALGGDAHLMLHGFVWPVYTDQGGPRGDDKFYVQSMAMATASGTFSGGRWMARTMLSLEPAMRHDGYPNLFATGEVAYGQPLVDRQHPHDLFMELAGRIDFDIGQRTSAFLYGGPVAEPALGPSGFMHRASARYNPEAPITHHWFDSTHITYGVVTAGVSAPRWQLEASTFRGREPDEFRWNIETPKLDSWSARASFAASDALLLQASYGEITEPEAQHPGEDEHRTTVSAHFNNGRGLSAMAAFSAKNRVPGDTLTAWLGEVNWDITARHTLFGRVENLANDEFFPDHSHPLHDEAFRVSKFQAGYAHRIPVGPLSLAFGGTIAAYAKPAVLDLYYGSAPIGYTVFARFSLGD